MKLNLSYKRAEATTAQGDAIEIKLTYTSFNKAEIDAIQELLSKTIKAGTTIDMMTATGDADDR